eukprot:CAMPEP_0172526058 /NCGR_PEP_ID=MMETSP1067-20121228/1060_1 /TAXON_ID=265564 ORGANISM="Thalassiosira punctigera, Strain Tpunct2005C2" /NCGR_SAMPLE_ID=MMETSP1067 /ASSEMBLY_ACC=CAM_ASM_000444 /LENGTH=313 /DNA_ID=CAMNT_0013309485 /DNA_START=122 /DNA_END=1063 /DNA_ORIENTATION=+
MAPPRKRLPCLNLLFATAFAPSFFSAIASAFTPRHPRHPRLTNPRHPSTNPRHPSGSAPSRLTSPPKNVFHGRRSGTATALHNFLDAVGGLLGGPSLEPETNLPYDPPFSPELSVSGDVRTFAIKERPISFTGEDFDIVDITSANEEDFVRVRGAMLHLPGKDKMRVSSSATGEKLIVMDRVLIAATPSYDLYRSDGTKIGWMEKKLISFMDTFDVYMEGKGGFGVTGLFKPDPAYRIEGDFLDRNFAFKNQEGKTVAMANMDGWVQLDMMNHYQVQVAQGMDALLVLACVCCIDEEFDEEHQKRREERQKGD